MKTVAAFMIVIAVLAACSKSSSGEKDTQFPVITLTTPVSGQVFTAGQNIVISGSISDNNYIAEVHIHVTNTNTGTLLMDIHLYPGNSAAAFNQPITAMAGFNYKIQVIAKDRAVNEARSSVEVSCN